MNFKRNKKKISRIEVTPMIDVIFLLLIFFMISTTFVVNPGIKINLPVAASKSESVPKKTPEIGVNAQNVIFLNDSKIKRNALGAALIQLMKDGAEGSLIIKADGKVRHQVVVFIMDKAKKAGFQKLSIATRPSS